MVIGVTVCAMWMHTGFVQQSQIETLCEYMTDPSWANWDPKGCLEASSCPYYCMCQKWTGSEWETEEHGTPPWAIDVDGEGNWVSKDRPAITRTDHFASKKGGDLTSLTHEEQPKGW